MNLKEVKTKYTMIFPGTTNNNYREVPEPPHFRLHYTPTLANLSCQSCDYIYSYKLTMISIYMYSPISVCRAITVIEILYFGREYFLKSFLRGETMWSLVLSSYVHEGGIRTPTIQLQVLKTLTITYLGTYPRYTCSPSRVFSYYCQFLQILRGLLFQIPVSEIIYFWRL